MAETARIVVASALLLSASALVCTAALLDFDRAPSVGLLRPRVLLPAAALCLALGSFLAR